MFGVVKIAKPAYGVAITENYEDVRIEQLTKYISDKQLELLFIRNYKHALLCSYMESRLELRELKMKIEAYDIEHVAYIWRHIRTSLSLALNTLRTAQTVFDAQEDWVLKTVERLNHWIELFKAEKIEARVERRDLEYEKYGFFDSRAGDDDEQDKADWNMIE